MYVVRPLDLHHTLPSFLPVFFYFSLSSKYFYRTKIHQKRIELAQNEDKAHFTKHHESFGIHVKVPKMKRKLFENAVIAV